MRAIDLYAGIGGWSLGLRAAGIEVVHSYEWWQPAIDTHNGNHGSQLQAVDIRQLDLRDLPSDIDLVVGSPPCTEFSYANRGGGGNISEGLKDIAKFLEIVEYLKPIYWVFENVPRVAQVLSVGFNDPNHVLYRFRHLNPSIEVVDFSEFGAPQARKRCIVGNIPLDLLNSYRSRIEGRTLGQVVSSLSARGHIVDPVWQVSLRGDELTETETEAPLNDEELRMNREAKAFHPVYNNMAFPDPLDQPARTVTATCTRVSRESIVIQDPRDQGKYRRLSIRERACLQGFPITYQFYAKSFSEKAKMVGNAIPPTFTFLVAQAVQGISAENLRTFANAGERFSLPIKPSKATPPDKEGKTYPAARSFRAALPGLRFKSGMRFDLSNRFDSGPVQWKVRFYYGSSKEVREIELDGRLYRELKRSPLLGAILSRFRQRLQGVERTLATTNPLILQDVWAHRAKGLSPFALTDLLGSISDEIHGEIDRQATNEVREYISAYVLAAAEEQEIGTRFPGSAKLEKFALRILTGFIVGSWFNTLDWHDERRAAA